MKSLAKRWQDASKEVRAALLGAVAIALAAFFAGVFALASNSGPGGARTKKPTASATLTTRPASGAAERTAIYIKTVTFPVSQPQVIRVSGIAIRFPSGGVLYALARQVTSRGAWFYSDPTFPNKRGGWTASIVISQPIEEPLTIVAVSNGPAGTASSKPVAASPPATRY
jgi:hypothetical protein